MLKRYKHNKLFMNAKTKFITHFTIIILLLANNYSSAQKRTILCENSNIKITHDFYENLQFNGFYQYPHSSIYYISEGNINDTICNALTIPIRAFCSKKYCTLLVEYASKSFSYFIYEKKNGKWEYVCQLHSGVLDSKENFKISQIDFNHIEEEIIDKNGNSKKFIYEINFERNSYKKLQVSNERSLNLIKEASFPIFNAILKKQ